MRVYRIIAVAAAVMVLPGSVGAQTLPIREQTSTAVKETVSVKEQAQLRRLSRSVARVQLDVWRCQDKLGNTRTTASVSPWALPTSVPYRGWVLKKWTAQKASCAASLSRRTLSTGDWVTAVRLVQRVFPGTADWLLYISHREGGHGGFVMNHQGSGAGGWLQYMPSTYWAYSYDAFAEVKRRGFIVDPSNNQWTNPLGQAITGAYMRYTGRDGHHWDL